MDLLPYNVLQTIPRCLNVYNAVAVGFPSILWMTQIIGLLHASNVGAYLEYFQ
jgi:hypothetical protein